MDYEKQALLQKLTAQIQQQQAFLDSKESQLNQMQQNLTSGVVPTTADGGRGLEANMRNNLPWQLQPGNLGDINSVIWPFQFVTQNIESAPNTNVRTGFQVTQEAAFVWMSFVKVVYAVDGGGNMTYIDPDQPGNAGQAYDLAFTVRDSQSQRSYENLPTDINTVGHPRWPTKYPRPMLLLPNSNTEISFQNSNDVNTYVAFIVPFGYRIRIQDAQNILSLIYA